MWHINFHSGGIGSHCCGNPFAATVGADTLIHLFTDTMSEDADLYRFLPESASFIGGKLVRLADGRNLWELFNEENFIGNTRVDICSRILKRDIARKWVEANFKPDEVVIYFGIDSSESRRTFPILENWKPYTVKFPLCEFPRLSKCDMLKECERDGIDPPRIYDEGFPHNNCGGFCVKGGHAHFLQLLTARPDLFDFHAREELAFRERVGKDVAILRDRKKGVTSPLTLLEFRHQIESGTRTVDPRDWGGCLPMLRAARLFRYPRV